MPERKTEKGTTQARGQGRVDPKTKERKETSQKEKNAAKKVAEEKKLLTDRVRLRDQYCRHKPGDPSDYTFVVSGTCRPIRGTDAYREKESS